MWLQARVGPVPFEKAPNRSYPSHTNIKLRPLNLTDPNRQGLQLSTGAGSTNTAQNRTAYAQICVLKRRYRRGPCLCPAVTAPPQLAVEPRRGLRDAAAGYRPRDVESVPLHRAVRHHRAACAAAVAGRVQMMPKLVKRELDGYVGCGVLARGFARVRCGACGHELLVPCR